MYGLKVIYCLDRYKLSFKLLFNIEKPVVKNKSFGFGMVLLSSVQA